MDELIHVLHNIDADLAMIAFILICMLLFKNMGGRK